MLWQSQKRNTMNILNNILNGKVVIVGIGNVMKVDDGFGPALIKRLKGSVKAVCIDAGTAPENYVGPIARQNPDTVLLVDAAHINSKPGDYAILKPHEILKSGLTTHDISPKVFIDYLRSEVKADIYMLGVQPERIRLGGEMSDNVKKTLKEVTKLIEKSLGYSCKLYPRDDFSCEKPEVDNA